MVYANSINGSLKHYRDSGNQEVDAIIELPNGSYCAIEVKLYSEANIKEGEKSLLKFEKKMVNSEYNKPVFKMILTSHGSSYTTSNGIFVVPITMLKD